MGLFDYLSSKDIGIDLGTSSVLVYVKGQGIVLREPSIVAVDTKTDKIIKVGKEAQYMQGRTPEHIITVRPLKNGVISRYDVTLKMLQHFIRIPAIFIIDFRQSDDKFSGLDARSTSAGSKETVTVFLCQLSPVFFRLSLIYRVKMLLFLAAAYIIYPSHKVRQLLMSNITCSHILFYLHWFHNLKILILHFSFYICYVSLLQLI